MSLKIDENDVFKTSSAIVIQSLGTDQFAVWNRFVPTVLFLNSDGIKLLEYMKTNTHPYKVFKGYKRILKKMAANNLFFMEKNDPYKEVFLAGGEKVLKKLKNSCQKHCDEKLPFLNLTIFNHSCNLKCPYCIVNYVKDKKHKPSRISDKEKSARLAHVIDQILTAFRTGERRLLRIMFNGGEILLEWKQVKFLVNYIKEKYPDAHLEFNINTNATLITDEIASFFAKNKFDTIGVSIDGYKETHNKTRQYFNGKGSFDDVLAGINILNNHLKKPIRFFQGTLIPEQQLDIDKLMDIKKLDFDHARLGINLLGITTEKAKEMAELHYKMALKSVEEGWSVMDDCFKSYRAVLTNRKVSKNFSFFCRGFSDLAGKMLYYNIETQRFNILCHYITDAHFRYEDVNGNIYHPQIFEKGQQYLHQRFKVIKEACSDCEIVGICRGGCVLDGIDSYNKKNESACVFQKETWKYYLQHAQEFKNKKIQKKQ